VLLPIESETHLLLIDVTVPCVPNDIVMLPVVLD
jgi:hypothetical protein